MVVLSFEEAEYYLQLALSEARQCLHKKIREIPIYCFLINENRKILSIAHNQTNESKNGSRHCELVAIDNYILGSGFEKKKNKNLLKCFHNKDNNILDSFDSHFSCIDKSRRRSKQKIEKENTSLETPEETDDENLKEIKKRIDTLKTCCIVVTCEPCGMCTYAMQLIGIEHIYFCCKNNRFGGCVSFPTIWGSQGNANMHFIKSKCTEESISLLRIFYEAGNPAAPEEKRKRPLKEIEVAD